MANKMVNKEKQGPEPAAEIQVGITDDFEVLMVVSLPEALMSPDIAMQLGRQFIKTAKEARAEKEANKIIMPSKSPINFELKQ